MSDNVFVTYPIPSPGIEMLRDRFDDVRVAPADPAPRREDVINGATACAGLLTLVRDRVDEDLLAALPDVRVVSNFAVGYDNIDVPAATAAGVMVTNTPDVLTETTADLAFALLMAAARRMGEGERLVRSGGWTGWNPDQLLGVDVHGATLGIVGFGRIGRAVAARGKGFGMRLLHTSRHDDPEHGALLGSLRVPLDELLEAADFVSLHVPLTGETRHLIDEAALRRMKKTAVLVNTTRGPVADEAALIRALRDGWIAAAGLDVYENEPRLADGLAELENVVLLPHLGSATVQTRAAMSRLAATNLIAALSGERPPSLVNPEVLHRLRA